MGMTKLYISMYIEWVEWFTYLLMGTFSYMDNVQHNSLWASYLLKLGECWKKAISPSFSTYFFISSNSTSSYIPLLSTLLPGHTVVDLLWNLMTDLSWLTGTFLSRNQLRNLSCNIPCMIHGVQGCVQEHWQTCILVKIRCQYTLWEPRVTLLLANHAILV